MLILALDTALETCSAALVRGGRVLAARSEPMARGHQERIAPLVDELAREAGIAFAEVDRIGVTCGPGSFTGLRVGLAFAKGLGFALGRPVVGDRHAPGPGRRGGGACRRRDRRPPGPGLCAGLPRRRAPDPARGPVDRGRRPRGWPRSAPPVSSAPARPCSPPPFRRPRSPPAASIPSRSRASPRPRPSPNRRPSRSICARPTRSCPRDAATRAPGRPSAAYGPAGRELRAPLERAGAGRDPGGRRGARPGRRGRRRPIDGFVVARIAAGEAEILTLAVDPARRRRGSGERLAAAALDAVRAAGAEAVFLEVAIDNPAATALYGKLGFVAAGRRRAYYPRREGPRVDALILRRDLTP